HAPRRPDARRVGRIAEGGLLGAQVHIGVAIRRGAVDVAEPAAHHVEVRERTPRAATETSRSRRRCRRRLAGSSHRVPVGAPTRGPHAVVTLCYDGSSNILTGSPASKALSTDPGTCQRGPARPARVDTAEWQ